MAGQEEREGVAQEGGQAGAVSFAAANPKAEPCLEVVASRLHGFMPGCTPDGLFCPTCFASARLSAAAPELLDALKKARERLRYDGDLWCDQGNMWRAEASWAAMEQADAAIAKAEGQ